MAGLAKAMAFPFLLLLGEGVLFFVNYVPGTYLIGWDNLMPEFDLKTNFFRSLFGVWLENRGLGVFDGMAHTANLFHTFYIVLLSFVLPQSMVRYVFIHLTHLAGGIGFFYLAKYLTKNSKAAFVSSLFYQFNLGVIQMYYAPLEVFAFHFAALPILSLLVLRSLEKATRKRLSILFLGSILLSPQGFVPTVFLVFLILFGSQLFFYMRASGEFKKSCVIALVVFSANAFWILPYIPSAWQNARVIANTRINQFSSEEIFYRNKAYGDLSSVLGLKGFMIDALENDLSQRIQFPFMEPWRSYSLRLLYKISYQVLFVIVLIGMASILLRKEKKWYPFVTAGGVSFFFLANDTFPFSMLNDLFRFVVPLLGEAFRFPFTKFILLFAFSLSLFLARGFVAVEEKIKKFAIPAYVVWFVLVICLAYPGLRGLFFSPYLRLGLPKEYNEVFSYFQKQDPSQRVVLFPVHTFWNWQYRTWGQRGSGFLWYGIPQPILERAFDPWSKYNEQFYNEIAYAVSTQDEARFERVLQKYDIGFILLDQYIDNAFSAQPINYDSLRQFLSSSQAVEREEEFGKLEVYKTTFGSQRVYSLGSNVATLFPDLTGEKDDVAFEAFGNSVIEKDAPDVITLFPSLSTEKLQSDLDFEVKEEGEKLVFSPKRVSGAGLDSYTLEIPSLFTSESLIPVRVEKAGASIQLVPVYPRIVINGQEVSLSPKAIVFTPTVVKHPTSVAFVDIEQEVVIGMGEQRSYLLNNFTNSLKLSDGTREELLTVDTRNAAENAFSLKIPGVLQSVRVEVDKIKSPLAVENVIEKGEYDVQVNTVQNPFHKADSYSNVTREEKGVALEAKENVAQLGFYRGNLYHSASYIVLAQTRYESGLPMSFYADNPFESRAEVEALLSKKDGQNSIVIPPTQSFFKGYGLHFAVKSVGKERGRSILQSFSLYPFPLKTLKNTRFVKAGFTADLARETVKLPVSFDKLSPFSYRVSMDALGSNDYVVLSQAYNQGWKAYEVAYDKWRMTNGLKTMLPFLFGEEIREHVMVNSWANGWRIHSNDEQVTIHSEIIIVFLPQYLEFAGFGMWLAAVVFLLFKPSGKAL